MALVRRSFATPSPFVDAALTAPVVRRSLSRARHIIASSRYTERVLLRAYSRMQRTNLGCAASGWARISSTLRWQPARDGIPRLLTVSRLSEPRKNVDRVLHALSRLKDRHDFRYVVVGDGHDRARLERLAGDLQLGQRVRFTGFVNRAELLDIYAQSDLMVLASAVIPGSHEGFGIVYLEAAASGVPSLAARLAGAAEAVDEGKSGMYVEEPTVDAIAGALGQVPRRPSSLRPGGLPEFRAPIHLGEVVDHSLQYYSQPH